MVTATMMAGEPIVAKLTHAPGNGAAIGGLKVVTENGCGRLIEISPIGSWANGWESTEIGLHSYAVSPANGEAKRMT